MLKKKRDFIQRYILLAVIAIIIIILIIFLVTVKANKAKERRLEEERQAEIERIKLEEERKQEEIRLAKQREKEEEDNATGVIYLTFDDGPTTSTTPKILDILDEKNVKATFFVLHYDEKGEELIKREQESGHTIALHGYTHEYKDVYSSPDACMENFKKIQNQVYETTGVKPNIIRFPGGSSNTISRKYCQGIMTEVTQRALNEGFKYFDWSIDSEDSGSAKTSDKVYQNVTSRLKASKKNVVLMHDFSGNNKTVDALAGIIDYAKENGYIFRRISDETEPVTHKVNN